MTLYKNKVEGITKIYTPVDCMYNFDFPKRVKKVEQKEDKDSELAKKIRDSIQSI